MTPDYEAMGRYFYAKVRAENLLHDIRRAAPNISFRAEALRLQGAPLNAGRFFTNAGAPIDALLYYTLQLRDMLAALQSALTEMNAHCEAAGVVKHHIIGGV